MAQDDEAAYRAWLRRYGVTNPDDPRQFYDFRAAFRAGATPDATGHWPSQFKKEGHPNLVVGGFDTRTGARVPGTARASEADLIRQGWSPIDAMRLAAGPADLVGQDELTYGRDARLDPWDPVTPYEESLLSPRDFPGYEALPLPPQPVPDASGRAWTQWDPLQLVSRDDEPPLESDDFTRGLYAHSTGAAPYVRPQNKKLIDEARAKAPSDWLDRLGALGEHLVDAFTGKKPYVSPRSEVETPRFGGGGGGGAGSPNIDDERPGHLDTTMGSLYLQQLAARIAREMTGRGQPLHPNYRPAGQPGGGGREGGA